MDQIDQDKLVAKLLELIASNIEAMNLMRHEIAALRKEVEDLKPKQILGHPALGGVQKVLTPNQQHLVDHFGRPVSGVGINDSVEDDTNLGELMHELSQLFDPKRKD